MVDKWEKHGRLTLFSFNKSQNLNSYSSNITHCLLAVLIAYQLLRYVLGFGSDSNLNSQYKL